MQKSLKIAALVLMVPVFAAGGLFALDTVLGGDTFLSLFSPSLLAGNQAVAGSGGITGPESGAVNPALNAEDQRFTVGLSYGMITDGTLFGNFATVGTVIPTAYGVWDLSTHLVSEPFNPALYGLGTMFSVKGSFSKELSPGFLAGIGLDGTIGGGSALDWGLTLDIGIVQKLGDVSFMKNARLGAVLSGIGKWYALDGHPAPSPVTPKIGFGATLLDTDFIDFDATADITAPSFQNVVVSAGLLGTILDTVGIRVGWDFNFAEGLAAGSTKSLMPSFGIQGRIVLDAPKDDTLLSQAGLNRSEMNPSFGAKPLYGDVWAFAAGITIPVGVIDRSAPAVTITYPETPYDAYYISPNNDGKNDEIVLPVDMKDERYLMGYSLTVTDSAGNPVRKIVNKEKRPENDGVKGLLDQMFYVKKGVDVPKELKWDGKTDSGEIAKDGAYTFVVEAFDDNGNKFESRKFDVKVDATQPEAEIRAPANEAGLVFSPDGDGSKDSFVIPQSGSPEDAWTGKIVDGSGTVVKTFVSKGGAPAETVWDGKGDSGQVVPDGVYSYELSTTDRAKNSVVKKLDNIIVNTQQPPVSLALDFNYFSPNADGVRDEVTLSPGVPVKTGLISWQIAVSDLKGKEMFLYEGSDAASLKDAFFFAGKDTAGAVLPEGSYQAKLSVKYINGHQPSVSSPVFTVDLTPPKAGTRASAKTFSPNGDGKLDTLEIVQTTSKEEAWKGEIRNEIGKVVKTFKYGETADADISWDATDDAGKLVPDGTYTYVVDANDRAGNYGKSAPLSFTIDTEKKSVLLTADLRAFSPNGDSVKDKVTFTPIVQSKDKVASWSFTVKNSSQEPVLRREGKATPAIPDSVTWDGKAIGQDRPVDGKYRAELAVTYQNADSVTVQTGEIVLDTVAPSIELSADPLLFSPNGDKKKDSVSIRQKSVAGDDWEGFIKNQKGDTVLAKAWKNQAASFDWDGTDLAGNRVPDGTYKYVVASTDPAGNRAEKSVAGIVVDTKPTQVFVTASRKGFSPNGDGILDDLKLGLIVNNREGIASWNVTIADAKDRAVRTFSGSGKDAIPQAIAWDGKNATGELVQGSHTATLTVVYDKGDESVAETVPFILDTVAPKVAMSATPNPFSPDNDGIEDDLAISIRVEDISPVSAWRLDIYERSVEDSAAKTKERLFAYFEGQGTPAERLVWDGKSLKGELVEAATDYHYVLSVTDDLGNASKTEGTFAVDVLVIRKGDRLMIKVPSIVFSPGGSDFKGLDPAILEKNEWVLKRIAGILNRYSNYKVTILGHGNNLGKVGGASQAKIDDEERRILVPLATARAEQVRKKLVEYGVSTSRLEAVGAGSSEPVVDFKDAENIWKNRRVEFILNK